MPPETISSGPYFKKNPFETQGREQVLNVKKVLKNRKSCPQKVIQNLDYPELSIFGVKYIQDNTSNLAPVKFQG